MHGDGDDIADGGQYNDGQTVQRVLRSPRCSRYRRARHVKRKENKK